MKKFFIILVVCFFAIFGFRVDLYAKQANNFILSDIDDNQVELLSFRGKMVVLFFFATWCSVCKKELSELNDFIANNPDPSFKLLCISQDELRETLEDFWNSRGYSMQVLFDNKDVSSQYGVQSVPTFFLVDTTGEIVVEETGSFYDSQLFKVLSEGGSYK